MTGRIKDITGGPGIRRRRGSQAEPAETAHRDGLGLPNGGVGGDDCDAGSQLRCPSRPGIPPAPGQGAAAGHHRPARRSPRRRHHRRRTPRSGGGSHPLSGARDDGHPVPGARRGHRGRPGRRVRGLAAGRRAARATAGPAEVEARLRLASTSAVLAVGARAGQPIASGALVIDEATYAARLDGRLLDLTYKEFELLKYLAQHPGRVFTRAQLLQEVWGYDYFGGTRTVDVHVRRLRAKLGHRARGD